MLYRIAVINPMNGRLQQKSSPIDTYWTIVWAICIIRASKGRPTDISPLETLGHGVKSGGALWGNGCPSDDVKCCQVRFDGMVNTDFHAIKLPTSPLQLALQITMLACFLTEQQILYNTPRKINILNPTMQVFGSDEIPAISVAPPHLPSLQSCCLTNWPPKSPYKEGRGVRALKRDFLGLGPWELWPFQKLFGAKIDGEKVGKRINLWLLVGRCFKVTPRRRRKPGGQFPATVLKGPPKKVTRMLGPTGRSNISHTTLQHLHSVYDHCWRGDGWDIIVICQS